MGIWPIRSYAWWESKTPLPPISILSRSAVRRAAPLTRYCAHVMESVGGFDGDTPIIFASCLGNISVLFDLLKQMNEEENEALSPIRFSGSVHHAPASTVGVSNQHKGFLNAISANEDLCAMALLEATMTARERGNAMLVLGEERWPEGFGEAPFESYAVALLLNSSDSRNLTIRACATPYQSPLQDSLKGNPAAPIQDLLDWFDRAQVGDQKIICAKKSGGSWMAICD